jgi:hypothetical protein
VGHGLVSALVRAHAVSLPGVRMAAELLQLAGEPMSFGPSTIQRMSAYQRSTGLRPIGLHRPTADRLLRGVSQRCVHCGGDGYHAVGKSWLWCDACGGLGRLMTPKAQFTLRCQVMERYPVSAAVVVSGRWERWARSLRSCFAAYRPRLPYRGVRTSRAHPCLVTVCGDTREPSSP